jgi:hypothetical protein
MQASQRSQLAEREEEKLVHMGTIKDDEHKLNAVSTTQEETESQQHMDQINKLGEKIESVYYQVTHITIDNRPRLQKLQNMFKLKVIMKTANEAMGEILDEKDLNITELNHLIYAAATVITEEINGMGEYRQQTQRRMTPPWVRRIQGSINDIRKELSALVEIQRDNRKVTNVKRTRLLKKCNIEVKESLDQRIEELKQKVSTKTQRLSRYRKRQNQYYQNKMFRTDCKKFYNRLQQPNPNVKNAPGKEEVENFWREIYGKKVSHNEEACSIKDQCQRNLRMEWGPICEKDVTEALKTTLNWKAPGRDQIPNFWLKQLTATHKHIAAIFNKLIEEDSILEWLTAGVTYFIPKNENTENPKNYRPVTCLPMTYKLITSIISRCMQKYTNNENLLPKEQKGCSSRTKGCEDQLLISKVILQECKNRKESLSMAWIDYQKASDRVPHRWIIKSLELIGINNTVIAFTKKAMTYWRTRMRLHAENELIETEDIKIQCGIFQGDSLSPLLFCICLIPFIEQLNMLNTEYEGHITKTKISHLLYMDDLKLIAKSEEELRKQVQTVKTFGNDIHMEFGLEKCVKISFKKRKLNHSQNLVSDINREIQELEQGKMYKYLGIEDSEGIQHQQMKERLKQEYRRR